MASLSVANLNFFNTIGADAALIMDYSRHIAESGKPIVGLWDGLFGATGYNFTYFPLYPIVVALIIKLIGFKFAAIKIASLLFYLCNASFLYFYCNKVKAFWLSRCIVIFYCLDPLIIKDTAIGLYGNFFGFIFLLSFLAYRNARVKNKIMPGLTGGLLMGLSGITHLLGDLWVLLIFPFVKIFDMIFRKNRRLRFDASFFLTFAFTAGLFALWVYVDTERRSVFAMQVLGNIANKETCLSIQQNIVKAALNPFADFYLTVFRSYSVMIFILAGILFYTLSKLREWYFEFLFLFMPLLSLTILPRSQSYLVMIAPLIFVVLADILAVNKINTDILSRKVIVGGAIFILVFYIVFDFFQLSRKPSWTFNQDYYTAILKENTERNSVIVTDPALLSCATEGRKIYSGAILIYYWFRLFYDYDVLVKMLSPDYIILTEGMKRWGETKDKFNQREAFQDLLRRGFHLDKVIKNKQYGDVWIFKPGIKK